jgi:MFS family permease
MAKGSLIRALRHRNYRLYFAGQALSLIGTWTQQAGVQWLMSHLAATKSEYGRAGFAAQLPALLFPPFAGVIADRVDRRRLLITTQSLALLQAATLALLVHQGAATLWSVLLLNVVLSMVNAFDLPTRQTFLGDIVEDRDDLANAIALNSSLVNGTRLIGPSLAAVLMVLIGVAGCFLANALSFVAVIAALAMMRVTQSHRVHAHPSLIAGLADGWNYVRGDRPIRAALFVVAGASLFGLPYNVLLPYVTRELLGGREWTYGLLLTAPGLGAFVAGIWIASRGLKGMIRRLIVAPFIAGLSLLLASLSHSLVPVLICLFCAGFGFLILLNSANTLIQTIAAADKRGRVMGFYAIAFTGMAPLGNLVIPEMAERFGTANALRGSALACLLSGLAFAASARTWRQEVRTRVTLSRPPAPESAAGSPT